MDSAAILSELRYLAPEIATLVVAAAAMFVHLFFRAAGTGWPDTSPSPGSPPSAAFSS